MRHRSKAASKPYLEVIMIKILRVTERAVVVWLAVCCLPGVMHGQTTVTSDEGRVVIDGAYVRIETSDGVTEVGGDWRSAGSVRFTDTDGLLAELGAETTGDYIRMTLTGDILFAFDSTSISEESKDILANVAHVIRNHGRGEVLVIGHTDSVGDTEANLRLSRQRAAAIISWLHRKEGIPSQMLVGRGMGEGQPVASNTTPDGRDNPAGRARNRRVEVFVATTETADVRSAAMTVHTATGDVRIDEGRVEVGGVVVDAGGVRVGGLEVTSDGVIHTGTGSHQAVVEGTTCSAGKHCKADCLEGDCRMSCSAGATCDYACSGGDCEMLCATGATCRLSCTGGGCRFSCAVASNCSTSCLGGDCSGG
jgi:outer membrane protein OmpA-like peptidoglycan-associated protein